MYMVRVDVTPTDISCGVVGNTRNCAVALALQRAMNAIEPNRYEVIVGGTNFVIHDHTKGMKHVFKTSETTEHFIRQFDERLPVHPFRFEFDLHSGHLDRDEVRHHAYIWGAWNYDVDFSQLIKKPIKYEKIIPLVKDIQTVKEVKEPTTAELMEFINKSELSFDHQLVKV